MDEISPYFQRILDTMVEGIYISDKHGITLCVNATYEKLTGLNRANLVGKNVRQLKEERVFDTILNPQIVQTRQPASSMQQLNDGKWLLLHGCPVIDDTGEVALVVTFARDMTLIEQLKEQITLQKKEIEKCYQCLERVSTEQSKLAQVFHHGGQMSRIINLVKKVSETDANILLLGETGVGKDVFARIAHEFSPRNRKLFVKVDCSSIPENLIESELFGYVPGAFSGASSKGKAGYFEIADGGTVFLDEIGELPLSMQAKLLRVLQDREVVRVGATKVKTVEVRLIAATNKELEIEVEKGRFRSDLYYRLKVAVIRIPPLRERGEEILPLVDLFMDRYCSKYKKTLRFSDEAAHELIRYKWPGNIRELQNFIQYIVITAERDVIDPADLPAAFHHNRPRVDTSSSAALSEGRSLKEIASELERNVIANCLKTYGSVSKVAEILKVDRTTIFRKMRDYPRDRDPAPGAKK